MADIRAGAVVVTKFCRPGSKKFQKYIDYIDREEAVRTEHSGEYNLYADYMGNPEKTTGIFTATNNTLNQEEKKLLKQELSAAQENGSLMWQTVISFDNRWLEKNGLYDKHTEELDEKKMKEVARSAVGKMLKQEGLENALWSAAIHYNTDNIHIHVATVEPNPMRAKKEYIQYQWMIKDGKKVKEPILRADGQPVKKEEYIGRFKGKSIDTCKRTVVNEILNERENNLKINQIIRGSILAQKRESPLIQDRSLAKEFLELYKKLPDVDRKMWTYNSNTMSDVRADIDRLSERYLEKYHKKEFTELTNMIKIQSEKYKQAYGEGKSARLYEETKMQDLYTRLGNCILSELRNYDRKLKQYDEDMETEIHKEHKHREYNRRDIRKGWLLSSSLRQLKKSMKGEWEKQRNEREHDRLTGQEEEL